ncbi:MAG: hypothetical protein GXZ04_06820 [Clostridiales bacterium]|nr:hypothetical protein [Clostridiales bacterium]
MKRFLALLLATVLMLGVLPGLAAEYTLDEKLYKQVKDGSGLKITLKTQKTGGAFSVLDAPTNALLSALLPGAQADIRHLRGVGIMKGQEETEVSLTQNNQPVMSMKMLADQQYEQLTSTLFGATRYVDRRDGGLLMALLTGQDTTWPPVEGVLLNLNTAESTWQGAVARKLDAYGVKLTVWLQAFTKTESLYDAQNNPQTRVTVTVPAQQLKAQAKQMLMDLYSDTELLALLSQEMNARQAAAYLQPAMMNSFFQSLDLLPLNGNLVSERLLSAQGTILENKLTLPLGGARGLSIVKYVFTAKPTGDVTEVLLEYMPKNTANQKGAVTALMMEGGLNEETREYSYKGTLSMQPENGTDAFTVDAAEGDVPARVYDFNLLYAPEDEVVDRASETSRRDFSFNLRVVPQGDEKLTAQLIKANISLTSRLNSRSATYFTGEISWQDEGTQALIKADISGNTAPPWNMEAINAQGATRVDTMTDAQRKTLGEQLQNTIVSAFTALMMRTLTTTQTP